MQPRPDSWLEVSDFDALVLGTGILQSLLACALARAGKRVIHFDQNGFYGEHEAALTLCDLMEYLSRQSAPPSTDPLAFRSGGTSFSNVTQHSIESAQEFLKKENRAFSVDLCPRPIFADESLVRVLVRSGVHQYLEFKTLDKVYLCAPDGKKLLPVPNSRNDVFSSNVVDLKEKRLLMKFIQTCSAADNDFLRDHGSEKFIDFLRSQGLTTHLETFLLYAITQAKTNQSAGDTELLSVRDGIARIKMYMTSASIYGTTPFLYPLYGLGEISQAYCRASAVAGSIYVLKRSLTKLVCSADGVVSGAIDTEGQEFKAKIVVTSPVYLNNSTSVKRLARCVCVIDGPLLEGSDKSTLTIIPPGIFANACPIHVLQLDSSLHGCPKDNFLLQITTFATAGRTAEEDLSPVVHALCSLSIPAAVATDASSIPAAAATPVPSTTASSDENTTPKRPVAIWRVFFNQDALRAPASLPPGLHVVPDIAALPGTSWTTVLESAERLFAEMVPGATFLAPPAGQSEETHAAPDTTQGLE